MYNGMLRTLQISRCYLILPTFYVGLIYLPSSVERWVDDSLMWDEEGQLLGPSSDSIELLCSALGAALPPLKPGVLRLYSMKFCPFAQRTRLLLEAKGLQYETINVNLTRKPKWFLEKNPLGKVPVLEKDGKIVFDSMLCNEYLDKVYQPTLNPTDPYQKAKDMMLMEKSAKFVANYFKIVGSWGADEEAVREYLSGSEPLEKELAKRGTYFGGESPGMLDYNLWPFYERTGVTFTLVEGLERKFKERYPLTTEWMKRMFNEPAVKAVSNPVERSLMFYRAKKDGKPRYDFFIRTIIVRSG